MQHPLTLASGEQGQKLPWDLSIQENVWFVPEIGQDVEQQGRVCCSTGVALKDIVVQRGGFARGGRCIFGGAYRRVEQSCVILQDFENGFHLVGVVCDTG